MEENNIEAAAVTDSYGDLERKYVDLALSCIHIKRHIDRLEKWLAIREGINLIVDSLILFFSIDILVRLKIGVGIIYIIIQSLK